MYSFFVKRLLDIVCSLFGLIILGPLFLVVLISLCIVNNGKPFFFQKRPGKNGKIFEIIKFKTMTDERDANGELLPDFKRVTLVGDFVRKYSLDEIPQLISVLKGDMSLIGPRPLLVEYLKLYSKEQARRHELRPGITGWAQVNGRNSIGWEEKFALDVHYVDTISFSLDFKILWMTFIKVFKSEGVNSSTIETMTVFTGNNA